MNGEIQMQILIDEYNMPNEIVDIWRKEESDTLLEVQSEAIENFGLLDGENLIITAPSSAGKTFVGEIAAINSFCRGKKTIILVPMKAIAEEKYHEFTRKYKEFGLNIAISTRDHTEFDENISIGFFDIAVIIFEKMNILLTKNHDLLNDCGLIVVDELQLLNERSRGATLEILLTKIKNLAPQDMQFLGLSAVLANLNRFDEWIDAKLCNINNRPLELHESVLCQDGTLKVCQFNDGSRYEDSIPEINTIPRIVTEQNTLNKISKVLNHYLDNNRRILIFRKWKKYTIYTAEELASKFNFAPATEVIRQLRDIESTNLTEVLVKCLSKGVAFHNSDLSIEERSIIESDFRDVNGQIKIICSTSTLAMGINMPSSIVIIPDTEKVDPNSVRFREVKITPSEYKNMSGRAGRTRFKEEGRSILIANSPAEEIFYYQNYILGSLDTLTPSLIHDDLKKIMLELLSSDSYQTKDDVKDFLLSSYTGHVFWKRSSSKKIIFERNLRSNYDYLHVNGLLDSNSGNVYTTKLGSLCASSGVEVESFILLLESLQKIDINNWNIWEVIFPCLHCHELEEIIRVYVKVDNSMDYTNKLGDLGIDYQDLYDWSMNFLRSDYHRKQRIISFLILNDWINCIKMPRIEDEYGLPGQPKFLAGTIRKIAENTAWMIQTLYQIAKLLEYDNEFLLDLQILGEQVSRGIPAEGIELSTLKVKGLYRIIIKRLVDMGYSSLDKILETPANEFRGIINPELAHRIRKTIIKSVEESQKKAKLSQCYRLENLGYDAQVILDIYEKEGVELEYKVVDLLNAPPLNLGAERIENQNRGEPDIRLALGDKILVGSVTASTNENKNISNNKCIEIVSSGARMNPSAYVVFGRPDFHELAVENAVSVNSQLQPNKSYKLIPISELGEIFVQVIENKISKDEFVDILMNQKGLIKANSINN